MTLRRGQVCGARAYSTTSGAITKTQSASPVLCRWIRKLLASIASYQFSLEGAIEDGG